MEIITPLDKIQNPLRAAIFDMDGVTLNSMEFHYNWQKSIYEKIGDKSKSFGPYTDEWMDNYNKIYAEQGMPALYNLISHVGFDKNEAKIWKLYNEYCQENPLSTVKVDGVDMANVISEVYNRGVVTPNRMTRLRLGINTTKGRMSLDKILNKVNLDGCFDTIITYDDILKVLVNGKAKQEVIDYDNIEMLTKLVPSDVKHYIEKPNSLSAMLAINGLGVHPSEVIAFEDTANGIYAYKNILVAPRPADAYVVGVTWGFVKDKQKLINAGADAIMEHPKEIIPFLEMLGAFK
ncbi:HAD family phosphatase [archaeon]|nr:HAD family phosphatase [archaeon]